MTVNKPKTNPNKKAFGTDKKSAPNSAETVKYYINERTHPFFATSALLMSAMK